MDIQTGEYSTIKTSDWGRQKGESAKAHQAFMTYCEMGSIRSYAAVARKLNKSATIIARWGSRWRWQPRLNAYLAMLEAERLKAQCQSIQEMTQRHLSTAALFQEKLLARMESIGIDELTPRDLARWFEVVVAVERSAHGLNPGSRLAPVIQPNPEDFARPEGNEISEKIKSLSRVDRELLRAIALKYLRIFQLEAELASEKAPEQGHKRLLAETVTSE